MSIILAKRRLNETRIQDRALFPTTEAFVEAKTPFRLIDSPQQTPSHDPFYVGRRSTTQRPPQLLRRNAIVGLEAMSTAPSLPPTPSPTPRPSPRTPTPYPRYRQRRSTSPSPPTSPNGVSSDDGSTTPRLSRRS